MPPFLALPSPISELNLMLYDPTQAHNMPLIVTAITANERESNIAEILYIRFADHTVMPFPLDNVSDFVYVESGYQPGDLDPFESYDDANDAISRLMHHSRCVILRRHNPNDIRDDYIIFTREPVTLSIKARS